MKSSAPVVPGEASLRALPSTLLVGVSGGIDSVALLHALVALGFKPTVLHFDHRWRLESEADAAWVGELAERWEVPFRKATMPESEREQRETTARNARYAFFASAARDLGIADLVLAHHADDQVETYLLQILRGSGAAGRGMDPVTRREGLTIHRPWLGVWKKEILAYARGAKLKWREDSTNADTLHRRNRIRRSVLPYLRKQLGQTVGENLLRTAEIQRAESEWLDQLCAEMAAKAELSVRELRGTPLAQQRRTILRWLQNRAVKDVSFLDVEAVRGLIDQVKPAKINLSEGRFARRREGKIFLD